MRLTLTYSALFLLAGVVLLTITYLLVRQTGRVVLIGQPPSADGTAQRRVGEGADIADLPAAQQDFARRMEANAARQRASDLDQLLTQSGIALAITSVLALALGWLVAGRALRPLRTMTATARQITQHNLHDRLALTGPHDEIKDLADTIDDLLGRIQTAFDAQRRFVANASHELRTPLTWDRALIEVSLADPHANAATLRAAHLQLLESSEEKERLIDALLTLARGEGGLDRCDPFDLADLAEDAVLQHQAAARSLDLSVITHLEHASADGNVDLVKRLVANLVSNAITHNTESGRVEIITQMRDNKATLSVANTGPVIPDDELERLTEPFQRLDRSRTSHHDGHGLGLSIVRAIATAHHADLDIQPQAEGGLRVSVRFPTRPSDQRRQRKERQPRSSTHAR